MALARSASVPGGTNAGSLFGAPALSQPPASGSLFGSAAAKPAGSLFGATATTSAAPASSTPSLFGAPATTTSAAAPTTGGLFGGSSITTAAPAAGGLFGASTTAPAATTAPATGGGLFGAANTTTTSTAPATSGGLFGSGAAPTTTAPAASGGLFGASTAAKPATTTTGGLFGAAAASTPAPAASGGLFGSAQPSQQQQQQPQVVPGVRIDLTNLRGTTRFNDLQESLQKDIVAFDSLVQSYIEQKNQVDAFLPAHSESLEAIPGDVRFVARKYDGVSGAMASDLQAIQALRETVKQDAEHAQLSFKALDNQKLPAQFHTSGLWSTAGRAASRNGRGRDGAGGDDRSDGKNGDRASGGDGGGRTDLINYFSHTGDEIGQQLRRLESNLGEIEVHMYSVQAGLLEQLQRIAASSSSAGSSAGGASASAGINGGHDSNGSSSHNKVAELAGVLRDFEESILTVASVVGSARESMTGLQLGDFLGRGL
ncbi:hypothetical protein SEPCBS119000_001647 [Sporothrix epigloea]|uniref:Nucleoporin n=1 Tax=Sporothrix epigloea TaxID=1892477 RepID=A0ABP0DDI0_9PEZI